MSLVATQHIVTALVQNEAGTINRLVSLFRRRGFSLASFNAGDCEEPGFSRITLLVNGDSEQVSQCIKQLDKLIDVVECEDVPPHRSVSRELALIRLNADVKEQDSIRSVAEEFLAAIPSAATNSIVIEIADSPRQIENLIKALAPFKISEIVRTGLVAMRAEG